jgi:hypothetical protein
MVLDPQDILDFPIHIWGHIWVPIRDPIRAPIRAPIWAPIRALIRAHLSHIREEAWDRH